MTHGKLKKKLQEAYEQGYSDGELVAQTRERQYINEILRTNFYRIEADIDSLSITKTKPTRMYSDEIDIDLTNWRQIKTMVREETVEPDPSNRKRIAKNRGGEPTYQERLAAKKLAAKERESRFLPAEAYKIKEDYLASDEISMMQVAGTWQCSPQTVHAIINELGVYGTPEYINYEPA